MATIRCKGCGALYNYDKEGCCPKCGAYNRPPKRERVNADGTVQHMTDAAYEQRNHAQGKVCFEEKECHEKKVCYEDQARRSAAPRPDPVLCRKRRPSTENKRKSPPDGGLFFDRFFSTAVL
jgi:DNA-directed RNA polymerase subunit M/transcription elongation factor TFIIS